MKKFIFALLSLLLFSCAPAGNTWRTPFYQDPQSVQVSVQPVQQDLNNSLNLQAVGALASRAHSAQELEALLNNPATGVNNLSLDGTGNVAYINVAEISRLSTGSATFRLSTQVQGQNITLADIQVQPVGSQAQLSVVGNPQYYPTNNYYVNTVPTSSLYLWAWLLSPHVYYSHPFYGYGYYPSTYRVYHPVSSFSYTSRTTVYRNTGTYRQAPSYSSGGNQSSLLNRSLSSPTSSQKSFQVRPSSQSVGTGGFGSPKTSGSTFSSPKISTPRSSGSFGKVGRR